MADGIDAISLYGEDMLLFMRGGNGSLKSPIQQVEEIGNITELRADTCRVHGCNLGVAASTHDLPPATLMTVLGTPGLRGGMGSVRNRS